MADISANNKRIAKNTLVLYVRMFIMMAISLYTSRVVLKILGVEDFGIYNVVGGIVSMMGVINGAMSVSTTRYLTFELGKGDMVRLKQTFRMCVNIYGLLALILLILSETIGLWFLNTQLVIPDGRMVAANWVFQFSILSTIFSLLTNPYNAVIISREKMSIYAYISLADAVLKLGIVYLLLLVPFDKLIVYGFFLMLLIILNTSIYFIYCNRKYQESRYSFYWETSLFKQLLSYTGWNLFGSASSLVKGQGLNILLNMFFNPSVNAARGIAYQVNTTVSQFFTNFYTAVRPQITKYYAQQDLDNMFKLVFRSSKMAFFLILLISLPLIIEAPYVIQLWLGQLPEFVVPFMRLILVITAVDAMANPLMTTAHATGKIALYQSMIGIMTILNIPISYTLLCYGGSPLTVFYISLIIAILNLFIRLWIVKRLVDFPVWDYVRTVLLTCVLVCVISALIPCIVYELLQEDNFVRFIIVCILSVSSSLFTMYVVGLSSDERQIVMKYAKKIIKK
jgi:O-antigen/teichoic acid export membrane protein